MDAAGAEVGASYPVVEAWREERRLVLHVVVAFLEEQVEATAELLLPTTGADESRNVVRHGERILLTGGFIEERGPPRQIPRGNLRYGRIGNGGMEHLGMAPRHTIEPAPLGILRQDETPHVVPLVVGTPEVAPRARLFQIFLVKILTAKAACHLCNAPVAESIFNRSVASTVDAIGDVAQTVVLREPTTAMFLVVGTRVDGGIFQHGLEGEVVVDAAQAFGKGVGNDDFGIRTTLRAPVAVAATGIRHVALACVYI